MLIRFGVGVLLALGSVQVTAPQVQAAAQEGHTSFSAHDQEGGGIAEGEDPRFSPANAQFVVQPDSFGVRILIGGPSEQNWDLTFSGPPGQALHTGDYAGAMRAGYEENNAPGLDVDGDGHGCSQLTGGFRVRELTRDDDHRLTSFAATFWQRCLYGRPYDQPQLLGSIAWHARTPADPVPDGQRMRSQVSAYPSLREGIDGETVQVRGRLAREADGTWLPHKRVELLSRLHRRGPWHVAAAGTTDHYGAFSVPTRLGRTSDLQIRFAGNRDFAASSSRVVTVRSRWRVNLHEVVERHHRAVVACTVRHGRRGQLVFLERYRRDGWHRVAHARLSAHGRKVLRFTAPVDLAYFRAFTPASHHHDAGASRALTLPGSRVR